MTQVKNIHQFDELAEVPATIDEVLVWDASAEDMLRNSRKNFLGYTEYVALLTQSGTNAPSATVVKNDTGATVSYAYTTTGVYTMTFSSAVLTENKTVATIGNTAVSHTSIIYGTTAQLTILTANAAGTGANAILGVTPVIVRIYV